MKKICMIVYICIGFELYDFVVCRYFMSLYRLVAKDMRCVSKPKVSFKVAYDSPLIESLVSVRLDQIGVVKVGSQIKKVIQDCRKTFLLSHFPGKNLLRETHVSIAWQMFVAL